MSFTTPAVDAIKDDMSLVEAGVELQSSKTRQAALLAQIEQEKALSKRLYEIINHHQRLEFPEMFSAGNGGRRRHGNQRQDGRKIVNPEKNLKISAVRAYGWAKGSKKSANDARLRALKVVQDAVAKDYPEAFPDGDVPEGVIRYINFLHENYHLVGLKDESGKPIPLPQPSA